MKEFHRMIVLVNGDALHDSNWHKVFALSKKPCTNIHGCPAIEKGVYFEKWHLRYEPASDGHDGGYIFREINTNHGISGRHLTSRDAILNALKFEYISVFLEP